MTHARPAAEHSREPWWHLHGGRGLAFQRWLAGIGADDAQGRIGDFTATPRLIPISALAVVIGVVSAFVALGLLRLIGAITNLLFLGRFNTSITPIQFNTIGFGVFFVPIAGGILVGLIARYGSQKIRGHGIPEATEAILMNGSKVEPKVAVLKPISTAISIGSGGPFGAEGVIIMTGGAFGSLIAQAFHLTSAERKTLLVAGAAGGLSAVFATPLTAIVLAVEVLLFEFKPRSLIPVALASAVAALVRHNLLGPGPIFPAPPHAGYIGYAGFAGCVAIGLSAGAVAFLLNVSVRRSEGLYHRLPVHWMWWPAIGGAIAGAVALWFPEALGPGYDNIARLLAGDISTRLVIGVLVLKSLVWVAMLGSETSGGTLAPILMIGCALGAAEAHVLPFEGAGFWPLVAMGAVLAGTLRAPLTGIILALEVTHDVNSLLPVTAAVAIAYGLSVLTLRRSMLTQKIAERGFHSGSEYQVDPLAVVLVREVMRTNIAALPATATIAELAAALRSDHERTGQRLYPIVDADGQLQGVISRTNLQALARHSTDAGDRVACAMQSKPVVAFSDEPLSSVAYRMAQTGFTRMPVVERVAPARLMGMVSLTDLLAARSRTLDEERTRERVLRIRLFRPTRARTPL